MNERQLFKVIRNHLNKKRYVIVLDDIWSISAWESMKNVFPNNNQGTNIIVTTRDETVAHACCSPNPQYVFKLQPLSPKDSEDLFCKKVFSGRSCPDHLKELTQLLLKKCGGLPLVVETIGGALANGPTRNIDDFNNMLDHFGSGLEDNPSLETMTQIMSLSYNALPFNLKRCFLYLSIFPEDYEIDSKQLQRLWIAEGMVEHRRDMTPEEVAQSYFRELISRCLLQHCKISDRRAVKRCRIHDILLQFVISKSAEENMVTVYNQHNRHMQHGVIRRLSLTYQCEDDLVNIRPDRLRSVAVFGDEWLHGQLFQKFKLLRVLDLSGVMLEPNSLGFISKLYHLKYLNLRGSCFYNDPFFIGELRNLEMLDVRQIPNFCIPSQAVRKLNKLRYLRAYNLWPAPGLGILKDLQVLEGVTFQQVLEGGCVFSVDCNSMAHELRNLNQLRKLGMKGVTLDTIMSCCVFITETSRSLRSLKVQITYMSRHNSMFDQLDSLASPPLSLKSLSLSNYCGKLPGWITLLKYVSKIVLESANLHDENIQALQRLPNLLTLKLNVDCDSHEELHFGGGGFPHLKSLTLEGLYRLKVLAFDDGSMPSLEVLRVSKCYRLHKVSQFLHENLPSLKEVVAIVFQYDNDCDQVLRVAAATHPNNLELTVLPAKISMIRPCSTEWRDEFGPEPLYESEFTESEITESEITEM